MVATPFMMAVRSPQKYRTIPRRSDISGSSVVVTMKPRLFLTKSLANHTV